MTSSTLKIIATTALALSLAACSSTRHANASGAGITDGNGTGYGENGAVAHGLGENGGQGGGFQPAANCNVPQTAGLTTDAYYFDFNSNDVHQEDTTRLQSLGELAIVVAWRACACCSTCPLSC